MMSNRSRLGIIEQTHRDSVARRAIMDEGRAELSRIVQGADDLSISSGETGVTRPEVYDHFVNRRRAEAAKKGEALGHIEFQYVPFEQIGRAVTAFYALEAFNAEMDALPGFWNFAARLRVHKKYRTPEPLITFVDSFATETLGEEPPQELDYIWEENEAQSDPYRGLSEHLERKNFVTGWKAFAAEHGVPAVVETGVA